MSALHLPKNCQDTFLKNTFMVFTESRHPLVLVSIAAPKGHLGLSKATGFWAEIAAFRHCPKHHEKPLATLFQIFSQEIKTRNNYHRGVNEGNAQSTGEFYFIILLSSSADLFVLSPAQSCLKLKRESRPADLILTFKPSLLDPTALTQEAVDSAVKKQTNDLKPLRLQLFFFFFLEY